MQTLLTLSTMLVPTGQRQGPGWCAVGRDLSPHENLLPWVDFLGSQEDSCSQAWGDLSLVGWAPCSPTTLSGWTHS